MNRRTFLHGSLTTALPATGRPDRRAPADTMPEEIAAWSRSDLDATYERLTQIDGVWAIFVSEARRPGTSEGTLTITYWDGVSFNQDEVGAPAFRDFTVAVLADYLDVEIDATVPYQAGISSMARPSLPVAPEEQQTLEFSLVLGASSTIEERAVTAASVPKTTGLDVAADASAHEGQCDTIEPLCVPALDEHDVARLEVLPQRLDLPGSPCVLPVHSLVTNFPQPARPS